VSILFWGDSVVPILGDLAPAMAPGPEKSAGEDHVIDALMIVLASNDIPITPLEEFIAAESAPFCSQEIIVEIVPVPREP
jgi:hypothetical protein